MEPSDSHGMKQAPAQPSWAETVRANDKKRRTTIILIIAGVAAAIGLYILFIYWHPFWRYQPGYVSEAQFGEADWPFTVPEARLLCPGGSQILLQTRVGIFGLTSGAIAHGYKSLDEADIWKYDPTGWHNRLPADKFWTYVNTFCK
jgi:hypothetical protein